MDLTRRRLLIGSACGAGLIGSSSIIAGKALFSTKFTGRKNFWDQFEEPRVPDAFSITPVVMDGKWNWTEQPDNMQGYVDPREFELTIGLKWTSQGEARNVRGSTPVPVIFPEQEITEVRIEKSDECNAEIVTLSDTAAQLQVHAPIVVRGQTISATLECRIKLFRYCPKFTIEQFPALQSFSDATVKQTLGNSPGIRADLTALHTVVETVASKHDHPWTMAEKFFDWVWENIQGRPGAYTSIEAALKSKVGDCEERAGVFVALCRAAGIPARLVLVPNHCWAEFCLMDTAGVARWIPAHTAAYNWFGWTGAHELVLQKGDRIWQPGSDKTVRLVTDWYAFEGRKPIIEYIGELRPVDGPGARTKNANGGWDLTHEHADDRFLRA